MEFDEKTKPSASEVTRDIDLILWSSRLETIRRYHHQKFWEKESVASDHAMLIEGPYRLESVAEHSWHVADMVLLLCSTFRHLDLCRCLRMAILHDKMEIMIGDRSPVGRGGTGNHTHAFNIEKQHSKEDAERTAISNYVSRLSAATRALQEPDLLDLLNGGSAEARFVKAVDKLQALTYVILKKSGDLDDTHLRFTLRYSAKTIHHYSPLRWHYEELSTRLLLQVAKRRNMSLKRLHAELTGGQLDLNI